MDADDTLLDFVACERRAITRIAQYLGIEKIQEFCDDYHVVNDNIWKEFERGLHTVEQIVYMRFDRIFDMYDVHADSKKVSELYKEYLSQEAVLLDGAREFLDKSYREFRLFIVTNGITYTQERRFDIANLNHYFENIFVSEQIGSRKPQKEFFDYVNSHIDDYDDSRAVVVGDSLTSDIAGGYAAGLPTIWFNVAHKPLKGEIKPTYEIDDFDDLYRLLSNF